MALNQISPVARCVIPFDFDCFASDSDYLDKAGTNVYRRPGCEGEVGVGGRGTLRATWHAALCTTQYSCTAKGDMKIRRRLSFAWPPTRLPRDASEPSSPWMFSTETATATLARPFYPLLVPPFLSPSVSSPWFSIIHRIFLLRGFSRKYSTRSEVCFRFLPIRYYAILFLRFCSRAIATFRLVFDFEMSSYSKEHNCTNDNCWYNFV